MTKSSPEIHILLDNIRSTHNVGSIFRTADAAGVAKIYCLGTTPVPIDRFGRRRNDIAKVALGAQDSVAWEHVGNEVAARSLIWKLKKDDFEIVAVEQDARAVDYRKIKSKQKMLIILGNEVDGVSKTLLKMADAIVEIPMKGTKESLNVSVAAGIVLFALVQ